MSDHPAVFERGEVILTKDGQRLELLARGFVFKEGTSLREQQCATLELAVLDGLIELEDAQAWVDGSGSRIDRVMIEVMLETRNVMDTPPSAGPHGSAGA